MDHASPVGTATKDYAMKHTKDHLDILRILKQQPPLVKRPAIGGIITIEDQELTIVSIHNGCVNVVDANGGAFRLFGLTFPDTETETERNVRRNTTAVTCGNCDWSGTADQIHPIDRFHERVTPGEVAPYGQCPDCSALCHASLGTSTPGSQVGNDAHTKIHYIYHQRTITEYSGVIDVPNTVIADCDAAVHEYVRDHESEAKDASSKTIECLDEVAGTMEFERDI